MPAKTDLTGRRFGSLTVLSVHDQVASRVYRWKCQCDCGNTTVVRANQLRSGGTRSCGCRIHDGVVRRGMHGQTRTPLYRRWRAMIERTRNPNNDEYRNYGGRGIAVCERWQDFANFAADMGDSFAEDLTLDRIDVDGNYGPENCRWATSGEQQRNKRNNHVVTWRGRTMIVTDWAALLGINPNTLGYRIRRGWDIERALTKDADPSALLALAAGATPGPDNGGVA